MAASPQRPAHAIAFQPKEKSAAPGATPGWLRTEDWARDRDAGTLGLEIGTKTEGAARTCLEQ